MQALTGPRDMAKAKREINAAGYKGEPIVVMVATDYASAWFGWPTAPKLEGLGNAWFEQPDVESQKKYGPLIQAQAFDDVPFLPLGEYLQPTVYSTSLKGVLPGAPLFWNVERA